MSKAVTLEEAKEKLRRELRAACTFHTMTVDEIDTMLLATDRFAENIIGVTDDQRATAKARSKSELRVEIMECIPLLKDD